MRTAPSRDGGAHRIPNAAAHRSTFLRPAPIRRRTGPHSIDMLAQPAPSVIASRRAVPPGALLWKCPRPIASQCKPNRPISTSSRLVSGLAFKQAREPRVADAEGAAVRQLPHPHGIVVNPPQTAVAEISHSTLAHLALALARNPAVDPFTLARHRPLAIDLFRAFSPVKGRSPPQAARLQRALDRAHRLGKQSSARGRRLGMPSAALRTRVDLRSEFGVPVIGDLRNCQHNYLARTRYSKSTALSRPISFLYPSRSVRP